MKKKPSQRITSSPLNKATTRASTKTSSKSPSKHVGGSDNRTGDQRLQKYLAEAGITSRRKAEALIKDGRVRVNGNVVSTLGTKIRPGKDRIDLDGTSVRIQDKILYCFHKPSRVVSTLSDPHGRKCVRDYLRGIPARVFPIGRLDYDVTGLLLLTNDGDYMERILHPRYEIPRVYWAKVEGVVTESSLKQLKKGVSLSDGPGRAQSVRRLSGTAHTVALLGPEEEGKTGFLEVAVQEGRNHFVKRLLAAVELPVIKLCRVRFGPFELGTLRPGELREVDFAQL